MFSADKKLSAEIEPNRLTAKVKRSRLIEGTYSYVFALLPIIGFLLFSIFPIIISVVAMFCDINLYDLSDITWNNFEGFKLVFSQTYSSTMPVHVTELFVHSIGITIWIASAQFVSLAIALFISVLVSSVKRGSKTFQVLFFIPYICSSVAVALMWQWIFSGESFGFLNSLFGTNIDWTNDASTVTWCIIIAIVWQAPGYGIVMYKAALGNVNKSLYEAASIDGAGPFKKFFKITLPSIAPTTFYLMMAGIVAGLTTFDIAQLIAPDKWTTNGIGGEGNNALTLMRFIYYLMDDKVWATNKSYISAAAIITWILFIVTATFSIIVMYIRNKRLEK
ncbi:MAG: sugar ABC transporter permease [Muribaculaceae bacterium]|nr:sugar ABC transporter permease [Muribaculaceae bacterium]